MKKISKVFAILAILLTNIMCIVVTNICTSGYYAAKHYLTSAPWEVGLLFIIPFAMVTFLCAVIFQWITELSLISTYVKFMGIFLGCWLASIVLMEVEHIIRGKKYTEKLREYQNGGNGNES